MIVLGIDPGTPITIAALSPDGAAILGMWDLADVATEELRGGRKNRTWQNSPELIASVLAPWAALGATVVIEQVGPMPQQGLSSSCRFVGSMYLSQGVAAGLGMNRVPVSPVTWKKAMGLSPDKERSRALALQTWPKDAARFKRMMDQNRAEAALLALWFVKKNQRA